jgi:hypothetical protein
MNAPKPTLKQRAYHGLKEYLVISLYLWVVFGLFILHESIILDKHHIDFAFHGLALFNALALAKVMLIARELHFADYFKDAPLIVPTLFKSVAFALVLGCFKILEATITGLFRGHSLSTSIAETSSGSLPGILIQMVLLAVLLIPFFGFTELRRVFGEDKLVKVFFTSRHAGDGSS